MDHSTPITSLVREILTDAEVDETTDGYEQAVEYFSETVEILQRELPKYDFGAERLISLALDGDIEARRDVKLRAILFSCVAGMIKQPGWKTISEIGFIKRAAKKVSAEGSSLGKEYRDLLKSYRRILLSWAAEEQKVS